MAAQLFLLPFRPAISTNSLVIPGASLAFYYSGTLTKAPVYTSSAMTTPLANPVVANAAGQWPAIYFDTNVTYRVVLRTPQSDVLTEVDPYLPSVIDGLNADVVALIQTGAASVVPAQMAASQSAASAKIAVDAANSAVGSANSASEAAFSAGAYKTAVLQAVGQIPSNTVLQMPAATRTILRGFTNMSAGAQAYLGEVGREGAWVWNVGDYSTQIAADPDEGLYLKATSVPANQGAWCRVVTGNLVYFASWWGIGNGFVDTEAMLPVFLTNGGTVLVKQSRTFYYMANLLPDGAAIMLPAGTIKLAAYVDWGVKLKGCQVRGVPGKTTITTNAGSACFEDGGGFFRINGASSVQGCTFTDLRTTQAVVSPAAITVSAGVYTIRQDNPTTGIDISGNRFLRCSAPCIVYESSYSTAQGSYPAAYQATAEVRIHDNTIRNCDYEYQSIYGAAKVWYYNNDVECDWLGLTREFYGLRIIGVDSLYVYGNRIIGPGFGPQDARAFNVKSGATYSPPMQNQSINVHIYDNDVQNWPIFCDASAKPQRLFIQRNRVVTVNPPDNSYSGQCTFFVYKNGAGAGLVVIEDNFIRGYDAAWYTEFSAISHFVFRRNELIAIGRSSQPGTGLATFNSTDVGFFEICDNTIYYPAFNGTSIRFSNTPAAILGHCWGNVVPESNGNGSYNAIVAGTRGKIVTTPGGQLYDFEAMPAIPDGTNVRAALGSWNARNRFPLV